MSAAPCRHRDGHPGTDHGWLAERDGFIVVFPIVTSYPFLPVRARNCRGFFIERHCHEGLGEPADLRRILHAVEDEFATDPARRYVVGLSSGAAMAVVMAVAYSEDIAAAGAVPGLPYGEDACAVAHGFFTGIAHQPWAAFVEAMRAEQQVLEEQRLVPLMVIHSANDTVVPIKERPEPSRFLDRLLRRRGHTRQHPGLHRKRRALRARPLRRSGGGTVVETVFYAGPRFGRTHFWVGDREGRFADPEGPSASELLWSFFRQHELAP